MKTLKRIERWLLRQKEGILVGSIAATLIYAEYIYSYIPKFLIWIGLPSEPLWYGFAVVIFIGTLVGALIDSIYKPRV